MYVGKSTLLKVFKKSNFADEGEPTVGVDYFATIVDLTNGLRVRLQAWDTAGQEKFRLFNQNLFFYDNLIMPPILLSLHLLLFDVTRRSSFDHLIDWLFYVGRHIEPRKAVYQIVGCKIDLENEREISKEEGQAKTRQNVDQAFKMISEQNAKLRRGEFTLNPEWDGIKAVSWHLSSIEPLTGVREATEANAVDALGGKIRSIQLLMKFSDFDLTFALLMQNFNQIVHKLFINLWTIHSSTPLLASTTSNRPDLNSIHSSTKSLLTSHGGYNTII
uniref:Uncharacterized protein n=1 Tax=Tetranychus urticae TaxID=32264 RepID=T1JUX8_TETUR